ncbi:MAG: hypothetical protein RLZZ58_807, partial [Pseudomonadota bacterium]
MASELPFPALYASHAGIWMAAPGGETRALGRGEAIARAADTPCILLNAPLTGERLGHPELSGLDLLELFAFLFPARFAVPSVAGMARVLGVDPPAAEPDHAAAMLAIAARMMDVIGTRDWPEREGAWDSAQALGRLRWPWAGVLKARLETPQVAERWLFSRLPEWEDAPPRPAPRTVSLHDGDILATLDHLTGRDAEVRTQQRDYALAAAEMFAPPASRDAPRMVVAEAGTGTGKTLGYLAPAARWIAGSGGAV